MSISVHISDSMVMRHKNDSNIDALYALYALFNHVKPFLDTDNYY